jgi:hypothetical protein
LEMRAMQKARPELVCRWAQDESWAIRYLTGAVEHVKPGKRSLPSMVLVALSPSRPAPFALLRWIEDRGISNQVPIVALFCSSRQEKELPELGITRRVVKSPSFRGLSDLLNQQSATDGTGSDSTQLAA